ncbi:MAG: sodium/solute symporter [Pirellulaceae bacterium]
MPASLLLFSQVPVTTDRWYELAQRDPAILIPFVGYMLAVFAIAIVAHRYQRGADFEVEYYVAGRSFGPWVLALSWVATLASGGSFLGYPSLVYSYGWTIAFWVAGSMVTAVAGLGLVGKRINRLARQTGALTLVDLLRDRYHSDAIGSVYAVMIVVLTTVYLMAQFIAGAVILQSILATSYQMGLILFAVSVVAYTTYGGFRAVAWTDTMQGVVMIVGVVLLVPFAIHAAGGMREATMKLAQRPDPTAEHRGLEPQRQAYLFGPGPEKIVKASGGDEQNPNPLRNSYLPLSLALSMVVLRGIGGVLMPTAVPRMLAFRDTRALRRALMLLAPYLLLMYGSSLITMNCAWSLDLHLAPGESDKAVPEMAKLVAPAWLAGVLIAAPFAAVMSTVDSALLVVSGSVVRDLIQKTFRLRLGEKWQRGLTYFVTAAVGLLVLTLAFSKPPFLIPLVIHYTGGSASVLFWPSLATLYWKRANATGILAGLLGGGLIYVSVVLFNPFDGLVNFHPFMYAFPASAVLVGIGSLLMPRQKDKDLDFYFGRNEILNESAGTR